MAEPLKIDAESLAAMSPEAIEAFQQFQPGAPVEVVKQQSPQATDHPELDPESMKSMSPEALAEFSQQTKWSPYVWAQTNPEKLDDATLTKLGKTDVLLRKQGWKFSDIPFETIATAIPHMVKGLFTAEKKFLQGVAIPFMKGEFLSGEPAKPDVTKARLEGVAGLETEAVGFADLFRRTYNKLGRFLEEQKPLDQYNDEDAKNLFTSELSARNQLLQVSSSEGEVTKWLGGAKLAELKKTGFKLDPDEINNVSAAGILTLPVFGGAFKIVNAATGKIVGTALSESAAVRALANIRALRKFEAGAEKLAADIQSAENVAARAKAQIATGVEREAAGPLVQALEAGERAVEAIPGAPQIVGRTVQAAGKTIEILAKGASVVLPGIKYFLGARAAQKAGAGIAKTGEAIATEAGGGTWTRAMQDVLRVPGKMVGGALTHGAPMDIGLLALTAETPEEAQQTPLMGTAFGGIGGLIRAGKGFAQGQLIASRPWGDSSTWTKNYGNFPELDRLHAETMRIASPGVKQRVGGIRDLAESVGSEVYQFSGPESMSQAMQSFGIDKATADNLANTSGVAWRNLTDSTGNVRKVILLRDPKSAPHEVGHPLEEIFTPEQQDELHARIAKAYGDEGLLQRAQQEAFSLATTPEAQARVQQDWMAFLLDANGDGPALAKVKGDTLTTEDMQNAVRKYAAKEILVDTIGAVIEHGTPEMVRDATVPGLVAKTIAKAFTLLGADPFSGAKYGVLETPLKAPVVEGVKEALAPFAVEGAAPARVTKPTVTPPRIITQPEDRTAKIDAIISEASDTPPAGAVDAQSPKEILGAAAEAMSQGGGVRYWYHGAKGEKVGAEPIFKQEDKARATRREEIEQARNLPDAERDLLERTGFPYDIVKSGKATQILDWVPTIFASNAFRWARALSELKAKQPNHPIFAKIPELDSTAGEWTPAAWKQIFDNAKTFSENQLAGFTGAGEIMPVPEKLKPLGFSEPERTGTPTGLDQNSADLINTFYSVRPPKSGLVGARGKPLAYAGQEIAEAAGRRVPSVEPRQPFRGAKAEELGIVGEPVLEVNPLRGELEQALKDNNIAIPDTIEAVRRLNVDRIHSVEPEPALPPIAKGAALQLSAGFTPGKKVPIELTGPDGKKYKATFDGYWDLRSLGRGQEPAFTALENLPGSVGQHSSTMGKSLTEAGYKLPELPKPEFTAGEKSPRTGLEFKQFFSDVTKGTFGRSAVPFEPVKDLSQHKNAIQVREKHSGNFDDHIAKSIPTFYETQIQKAEALVDTLPEGSRVLDIAASEGSFGKTITELSDGKVKTVSLDPNPDMASFFATKSKVPGAEYAQEAFLRGFEDVSAHNPVEKYDAITESMGFQFIDPNRMEQVKEVKRLLKPDGVFLTEQKFKNPNWAANEAKKDRDFKARYFSEQDLKQKEAKVGFAQAKDEIKSVGMVNNMVEQASFEQILHDNFKHVVQYWDSGNFKGYIAGDNVAKVAAIVKKIGDTNSEFSTVQTPREVKKPTGQFTPAPELKKLADEYVKSRGLSVRGKTLLKKFDESLSKKIADYHDEQPAAGTIDETTRESYNSFNRETQDQFRLLQDSGYNMEPWTGSGEPYKSSAEMVADVQNNKHLFYLPTEAALGDNARISESKNYPPLELSDTEINGERVPYNDLFRAVHDVLGHSKEGRSFSKDGEFQAWQDHSQLYSDQAQSALALETLTYNAWFNTGKHVRRADGSVPKPGDPDYIPLRDRGYAPRKTYVFPQELLDQARGQFTPGKKKLLPNAAADEDFDVIHYSSVSGLGKIDPKFFGKGKATPTDLRGGSKSYFFVKDSDFGQDEGIFKDAGLQAYETKIPGSKLYDLRAGKPDDLGWRKTVNREEADDIVSDAGYDGIILDTADGRQVVAMFKSTPVKPQGKFTPGKNPQALRSAAVRDNDTGKIYEGALHPTIVYDMAVKGVNTENVTDGYITNSGEFLDREQAYQRATSIGQTPVKKLREDVQEHGVMETTAFQKARQFTPGEKFSSETFDSELEKIRAGESGGQTFTADGEVWTPTGKNLDVVTLASVNLPAGKVNRESVIDALGPYEELLDEPGVVAGVFSFSKEGKPTVSVDINATVPQKYRANSVDFAKQNDQVSIWDSAKMEEVPTGGKGETKLQTVSEILDAFDNLTRGKKVNVEEIQRQYEEPGAIEQEVTLPGLEEVAGKPVISGAVAATMTKAELAKQFPELVIPRRRNEMLSSEITESPLYKEAGSEEVAVQSFARKLVEFAREYSEYPAYKAGLEWYEKFTPLLKKHFGADSQLFAELLAATSPQTNVSTNFAYAFDAFEGFKSGRFKKPIEKFNQAFDMINDGSWEAWYKRNKFAKEPTPARFLEEWLKKYNAKPTQSNGKLYGQHSIPVLQVFARKWLLENRGPKTLNFVENLLGTGHEATIDLWADRTMRRLGYAGFKDRWRIHQSNQGAVSDRDFFFSQKAFRAAAEQLGIKPSALQGALWFAEKQYWNEQGWSPLDLGDFRKEMERIPALRAKIKRQLKDKPKEQLGFDLVEPRKQNE